MELDTKLIQNYESHSTDSTMHILSTFSHTFHHMEYHTLEQLEYGKPNLYKMAIVAIHLVYAIFCAISLLFSSNEEQELCPASNAWLCILLTLKLELDIVVDNIFTRFKLADYTIYTLPIKKTHIYQNCMVAISIGSYVWLFYELFGVSCVDGLRGNLIYDVLIVSVVNGFINCIVIVAIAAIALQKICSHYNNCAPVDSDKIVENC